MASYKRFKPVLFQLIPKLINKSYENNICITEKNVTLTGTCKVILFFFSSK